jgi:hydrogenase maturation factor
MCLGIPSKVIEVDPAFQTGRIDYLETLDMLREMAEKS